MKKHILLGLVVIAAVFQFCTPKSQMAVGKNCFTGKLVKKGICGQRVIQLMSRSAEGIELARNWTDSLSRKNYENVFTVANSCDFPATVQEGDEFSFMLTRVPGSGCAQCYAYTPIPDQKNNITVGCTTSK